MVLVILAGGFTYLYVAVLPMVSIATGYAAKYVCSCLFVGGLSLDEIRTTDLNFPVVRQVNLDVNTKKQVVTGSMFGLNPQTAVYRSGLGCALVHDLTIDQARADSFSESASPYSFNWPDISSDTSGLLDSTVRERVRLVVASAFEEPDPKSIRNTRGVAVFYKGHLVAEQYAHGATAETPLLGWSMSKSVSATIIGRMEYLGLWDRNETGIIPGWSDGRKDISVGNLLMMNSGLDWEEAYDRICDATEMLYLSDGIGDYASQSELDQLPGTHWEYSSGTTNLMVMAAQDRFPSAQHFRDFCYREVFHKIGVKSMVMETDATGYIVGSSYFWSTLRDWAKLGQLYLNQGVWEGERLLSQDWIDFVRTPVSGSSMRYGGSFWLNAGGRLPDVPTQAFSLNGFQGQRMFIIPEKELIIVRSGVTFKRGSFNFNDFIGMIVQAMP